MSTRNMCIEYGTDRSIQVRALTLAAVIVRKLMCNNDENLAIVLRTLHVNDLV